jgi:cellulose synthase/poly-beta-1,6-N-acetylglucosamine synthase-like glycosyltransferase
MLEAILDTTAVFALVYALVAGATYFIFTSAAWVSLRRYERARHYTPNEDAFASPLTPGISIILPAFNEEAGIVESVRSLLALHYPLLEIVVVNDGSTDRTLERLTSAFDLVPVRRALRESIASEPVRQVFVARTNHDVVVVDKLNGGKADALNAGLRVLRHPLVASIDADAVVDADGLLEVARPFLDDPDLAVASGGAIRISNGCAIDHGRVAGVGLPRHGLAALQFVEYERVFLVGRIPWSDLNALPIISGAFGVFRRESLEEIGGYNRATVGEDMDAVMRLHRGCRDQDRAYTIKFVPYAALWTEGPEDVRTLSRQRRRWQHGLGQVLWGSRGMFVRPRYGLLGLLTLPYFLVYEFLTPVIVLLGIIVVPVWWLAGGLSLHFVLIYLLSFVIGGLLTMAAVTMDQIGERQRVSNRELAKSMGYAVVMSLGYLQLVQACQFLGYVDLARRTQSWGAQRRHGIGAATETRE